MEHSARPPEIIDVVKQYLNEEVDEKVNYEISQSSNGKLTILQLKEDVCNELLKNLLQEELECPIKTAKKYLGKVNTNTIEQAFQNIDWTDYNETANLLSVDRINAYMNTKCRYCNIDYAAINKLSTLIVVNIYKTLGISKEIFLDFINSCYWDCNIISKKTAEKLWDYGQNMSNGTVCQHCFCIGSSPFFKHTNDIEQEEGAK